MIFTHLNGKRAYAPKNKSHLLLQLNDYKGLLIALNAEKILNKDEHLTKLINNNIGYPDGIGVVKALRKKGLKTEKIAGAELWLDIVGKFYQTKRLYLIGSSEEVIKTTYEKLKIQFEGINTTGIRNGFIKSEKEKNDLFQDIKEKKPDIVFVAQGSPRQEFLMEELFGCHKALYIGLGGSFDVYCGEKKRAPQFFISMGAEWFYRLIREPTRVKRQLVLLRFLWLLIGNKI